MFNYTDCTAEYRDIDIMMIITGDLMIREGSMPEALVVCQKHVEHSRQEPGCISHNVYCDPEDSSRLFFFEQWQDQAAIDKHFALPSSKDFVTQVREFVTAPPNLQIFSTQQIK